MLGRVRARGTHVELLAADTLYRDRVEALRFADKAWAALPDSERMSGRASRPGQLTGRRQKS